MAGRVLGRERELEAGTGSRSQLQRRCLSQPRLAQVGVMLGAWRRN
jgi:hypothetical protein